MLANITAEPRALSKRARICAAPAGSPGKCTLHPELRHEADRAAAADLRRARPPAAQVQIVVTQGVEIGSARPASAQACCRGTMRTVEGVDFGLASGFSRTWGAAQAVMRARAPSASSFVRDMGTSVAGCVCRVGRIGAP